MSVCGGSRPPEALAPAVASAVGKYGDFNGFLAKLGFEAAQRLVPVWQDEMMLPLPGKDGLVRVPTLEIASWAFGHEKITAWLMSYIANVNSFFLGGNVEKKMTPAQIEDAAATIQANYGKLLCSEVPVVFSRIKGGKYGKAYGVIDAGMICNCFQQYLDGRPAERSEIYRRKERAKAERERKAREAERTMSLDEFRRSVAYAELRMAGKAEALEDFVDRFKLFDNDGEQEDTRRHADGVQREAL